MAPSSEQEDSVFLLHDDGTWLSNTDNYAQLNSATHLFIFNKNKYVVNKSAPAPLKKSMDGALFVSINQLTCHDGEDGYEDFPSLTVTVTRPNLFCKKSQVTALPNVQQVRTGRKSITTCPRVGTLQRSMIARWCNSYWLCLEGKKSRYCLMVQLNREPNPKARHDFSINRSAAPHGTALHHPSTREMRWGSTRSRSHPRTPSIGSTGA